MGSSRGRDVDRSGRPSRDDAQADGLRPRGEPTVAQARLHAEEARSSDRDHAPVLIEEHPCSSADNPPGAMRRPTDALHRRCPSCRHRRAMVLHGTITGARSIDPSRGAHQGHQSDLLAGGASHPTSRIASQTEDAEFGEPEQLSDRGHACDTLYRHACARVEQDPAPMLTRHQSDLEVLARLIATRIERDAEFAARAGRGAGAVSGAVARAGPRAVIAADMGGVVTHWNGRAEDLWPVARRYWRNIAELTTSPR